MMGQAAQMRQEATRLRQQVQATRARGSAGALPPGPLASPLDALDRKLAALIGTGAGARGSGAGGGGAPEEGVDSSSLQYVSRTLSTAMSSIESAPEAPTAGDLAALQQAQRALGAALAVWNQVKTADLPRLNSLLRQSGLPVIE